MRYVHKTNRLFSKKTRERLELYFLLLEIFSLVLLILDQVSRA